MFENCRKFKFQCPINKVLLAHGPANLFTCCLVAAFTPQWPLSGCNKNHMAWTAYSVCYLVLYRRSCLWSQAVWIPIPAYFYAV